MASDHSSQHAPASTPAASSEAPDTGDRNPATSSTPGSRQESVGPYTTTQIGGNVSYIRNVPSQAGESGVQQPVAQVALPSPSDLERGMGDPTPNANTPVDVVLSVIPHEHPTSIILPPAPMPAVYGGAGSRYDARLAVDRSPQRQRQDPFAGSQDGSPPRQSYPNLPNAGSQRGSPVERFGSAGSHQQYRQDSGNTVGDGRGSRFRQPFSEEHVDLVGYVPASAQQGNDQESTPHQGFGARLRHAAHAAEDYLHVSFPHHMHETRYPGADPHMSTTHSLIDHIVPVKRVSEKESAPSYMAGSVGARLSDTLADAKREKDKYAAKAKWLGLFLNIAIGLQVLLGSLTTGLSAVATQGKSAAVETTILGALATLVASYLAQARGSNEPQLSLTRVKDLKQFIRECNNFIKDHGEDITSKYNPEIDNYRKRFENLLGNTNGERKQLPSGSDSQKTNSS